MKKFRAKRKFKKKGILFIVIAIFFIILFIIFSMQKLSNNHQTFVKCILSDQGFMDKENTSIFNLFTGNLDILLKTYHIEKNSDLSYSPILPIVYIYNTHDVESYDNGINTNIVSVSNILKNELDKFSIPTIVEKQKVSDYLERNNLNYNSSYKATRVFLEDTYHTYPSLNYFIDIHRDSVGKSLTSVTINGTNYAKIMFVLGLDNPNYMKNKVIIDSLNNYFNTNYPGLSRGVYEKKGSNVNGIYNQDFHENVMLIEIGGIENNLNEITNSTELLAKALYYVIGK